MYVKLSGSTKSTKLEQKRQIESDIQVTFDAKFSVVNDSSETKALVALQSIALKFTVDKLVQYRNE